MTLFKIVCLCTAILAISTAQDECQSAFRGPGVCIPIPDCKILVVILNSSKGNPEALNMLRNSHCGFAGDLPKVCCPVDGNSKESSKSNEENKDANEMTTVENSQPTSTEAPPPVSPPPVTSAYEGPVPAQLQPPECGISNASLSRVVGGVDAKLGDFPWLALLGYRSNRRSGGPQWRCGGSLVSKRHVLTAGHCIHNYEKILYLVRLGELDLSREDEGATPLDVPIKKIYINEKYDPKAVMNDIGILLLAQDVDFTDLIRPICLPVSSELRSQDFVGYNPLIAGWGDLEYRGPRAMKLQVLQLPILNNEVCREAYKSYKRQVIDHRVMCAGYLQGGRDSCQGDSGGPLMQPIWNKRSTSFYQVGIVSFGKKCAEPGFPGVYTRVTEFMPWINKVMLGHD